MMCNARLRPGSSRLEAMRRMAYTSRSVRWPLRSCLAASKEAKVCFVRLRRRVRACSRVEVKRCGSRIVCWHLRSLRKSRLCVARRE